MVQAVRKLEDTTAEFRQVAITDITPSKTNPRTHFNDEYLQQLGQSIAEKGVVEPLIVRSLKGKLEIVAGECRYRAAKLTNQTLLPCIVRSLTDEQALEWATALGVDVKQLQAAAKASLKVQTSGVTKAKKR